ncbi:MAG TPA: hypothetical protein VGV37_02680 [Aliidongia sp.]|uniref:hypothetical protein n=1 Tax=Aliidongia sp. TaxID=1914230 RepID=UPI002DDDA93D|nr:hypothetical protein [Aliidongia sp.]HEV2673417.1 hypothetical protein [Aliidongia sp.]
MVTIPVIDVPATEEPAVASARAEPERLQLLMTAARRTYTPMGMRFADTRSRLWSGRSTSPYAEAVRSVDQAMGRPGAFLLNYSYEWGCTTGAVDDADLGGTTLLRTLDWPFDGLGRSLIVVRRQAEAGTYLSATWPGFVGVLTGLAPGRFAAAINQPPLPLPRMGKAMGWLAARVRVNRSDALPPTHLLRLAFETCRTFDDAVALLRDTPICLPAIFTIAGTEPGEARVIERTADAAFEPDEPAAANHWASPGGPAGRPRNASSRERRIAMCGLLATGHGWSFDWLQDPILLPDTRLAVMANPRTGRMLVQGWEKAGPATAVLDLV